MPSARSNSAEPSAASLRAWASHCCLEALRLVVIVIHRMKLGKHPFMQGAADQNTIRLARKKENVAARLRAPQAWRNMLAASPERQRARGSVRALQGTLKTAAGQCRATPGSARALGGHVVPCRDADLGPHVGWPRGCSRACIARTTQAES